MNMFNNKGEINASSVREALEVLAKYATLMNNEPSNAGLAGAPTYSDEKRDELISRALMTQEGKVALAQSMANPIN